MLDVIQCNSLHMQLLLLPSSRTRCCGLSAAYQAAMVSTLACLPVSHNFAMPEEPLACTIVALLGMVAGNRRAALCTLTTPVIFLQVDFLILQSFL